MTRSQPPSNGNGNGNGRKPVVLNNASFTDSDSRYQSNETNRESRAIQSPGITEFERTDTNEQKPSSPQGKMPQRRKRLLLAGLGLGAIVAGIFGVRWWQYASVHEQTDDAFVIGHIHPVSSRVNGTVSAVLVDDNQQVQQGQVLVRLDPRDYQNQVQQAQAALIKAQRQAQTASRQIALSTQTTRGTTTQAQGNVSSAGAAITTAQAAVQEAQAGVPAAQAQVAQAEATLQRAEADYK